MEPNDSRVDSFALKFLEEELGKQRARETLIDIRAGDETIPPFISYPDFMEMEFEGPRYRIDNLWPSGGTVLLAAYRKTGKSTLRLNIIDSLTTGRPFLDQSVTPLRKDETLVDLNMEVADRTNQDYARPFGISAHNALVANMRGMGKSVNIINDRIRAEWVRRLQDVNCKVLIVDPIGPILRALGIDENANNLDGGGAIVEAFNVLLREARIQDLLLVTHTGHGDKRRARGSSVFGDSPDALWTYRRGDPQFISADGKTYEKATERYFAAEGRLDEDFEEKRILFDAATHRLRLDDSYGTEDDYIGDDE